MRNQILFLFAVFCSALVTSVVLAEEEMPAKIDSIKLGQVDMPQGFVLYQESVSKPGASPGERIFRRWRRGTGGQELVLVEERKDKPDAPVGGFARQIWYRNGREDGKKDKIEVEIVICVSQEQMEETITHCTTEVFATPYVIMESSFAGDRSWAPRSQSGNTFSVMFARGNVFVRLYVKLHGVSEEELSQGVKELAARIDKKIPF